ncbi:MAG TPA: peptidase M16, partial [Lachnospiraceae bacterium]|nr:peptidase M16 [Lachnospiraceae bacterium]
GLSVYANHYSKADDCNDYSVTFGIKFKCLYDNIEQSFDLAKEILFNSKLDDKKRLKEIISENKSVYLSMFSSAGHVLASSRAQSYISESSLVSDYLDGINFYNVLCDLEENFDEKADELISSLKLLLDFVLDKKKLFVDITADQEGYNLATNEISSFYELLSDSAITLNGDLPKPEIKNEAFTSSAMIQYVCRAGNFKNKGLEYTGALRVLKTLMGYEYLWNEVRVKGGAYGCMSLYNRNGNCYFVSYRDPNLENTIKIYEQAADYIANFDCDDDTLTKYIIGTISSMDTPLSPYKEGARSASLYLAGMTYDQLQKERDQVLNCKPEDIRELAGHIRAFMDDKVLCVVGNAGKIKENESLFKDIKPLA